VKRESGQSKLAVVHDDNDDDNVDRDWYEVKGAFSTNESITTELIIDELPASDCGDKSSSDLLCLPISLLELLSEFTIIASAVKPLLLNDIWCADAGSWGESSV
jgi:hypothetical protein